EEKDVASKRKPGSSKGKPGCGVRYYRHRTIPCRFSSSRQVISPEMDQNNVYSAPVRWQSGALPPSCRSPMAPQSTRIITRGGEGEVAEMLDPQTNNEKSPRWVALHVLFELACQFRAAG